MDNFLLLPRALAAAISDTAFAVAFGLVIVGLWCNDEETLRCRLRRGVVLCLVGLLLALAAQACLSTATMIGSADLASIRSQIVPVLTGTHAGRVLVWEFTFVLLLLTLLSTRFGRRTRAATWRVLTMLVVLAAIRSATGHSAADGDFTLPEFVQFVHLVSTAVWAGCVIAGGFVVLPTMLRAQRAEAMVQFTRRLSRAVTVALVLIVLSGLYNSCRGLGGSLAPMTRTQWGLLLDLKLVLVGVALVLGALNRRMLRSELCLKDVSRLAAILRAEAGVMLLILTVSAWLANSPPANS